jgi:polysaccharide export outer membrane protein
MQRFFVSYALVVCMIPAAVVYAQQPSKDQKIPNELVQYVRDARKAGLNDRQIQQNAVGAGWPADMVSSALAPAENTSSPDKPDAAAKPAVTPREAGPAPAAAPPPAPPPAAVSQTQPAAEGETPPDKVYRGVPDDYEIGAGDELQISVWKEPDASVPSAVVRPDGKISMPMLKDFSVVGLTPTKAEALITEQLVRFITTADVTVIVRAINSKKIYVTGGVKREGPIPYTYRMTILQALSEAGGLSDYAKKKKIYVLRHENGRDYRLPFDYDAALRGQKMELNIPLVPGDTIVVPK